MVEDKKVGEEAPASSQSSLAASDSQPDEHAKPGTAAGNPAGSAEPATAQTQAAPEPVPDPQPSPAPERSGETPPSPTVAAKAGEASAADLPVAKTAGRRVYQASTLRKTILSFVFLLLLPFFASVPAMIVQRVMHQLWPDMLGFAIFVAAFAVVMLLVLFELIHSIRARVVIGESAVRLTLPAARGIAMPKFFYKTREIPYSDIEAVETRREVYGGIIAPVMLRGARIVTKSGDRIPLGYVSEANVDPMLPVPEIAAEIARRAGLEVVDHGTVRRQVHKKLRGIRANDEGASSIAEADIAALNRRHNSVMLALCSGLFLIVAGGLALDISKSDLDLGEQAQRFVESLLKSGPEVQRAGSQQQ